MLELATHFQRGLHSGLDLLMDPDLQVYDSLLTLSLRANNIFLPHRTEFLHSGSNIDSTLTFTDTLGIAGDSSYIPGPKAQCSSFLIYVSPLDRACNSARVKANDRYTYYFIHYFYHTFFLFLVSHSYYPAPEIIGRDYKRFYQ